VNINEIKVFQVDDWAYVAARNAEEAGSFVEAEYDRPDDPEEREIEERSVEMKMAWLGITAKQYIEDILKVGEPIPSLIAIDGHYS
jgi:hypothetical protein